MIRPKRSRSGVLRGTDLALPGGAFCVAFVNTVRPRPDKRPKTSRADLGVVTKPFEGYVDLLDWQTRTGVVSPAASRDLHRLAADEPTEAATVFQQAVELREELARICQELVQGLDRPRKTCGP